MSWHHGVTTHAQLWFFLHLQDVCYKMVKSLWHFNDLYHISLHEIMNFGNILHIKLYFANTLDKNYQEKWHNYDH